MIPVGRYVGWLYRVRLLLRRKLRGHMRRHWHGVRWGGVSRIGSDHGRVRAPIRGLGLTFGICGKSIERYLISQLYSDQVSLLVCERVGRGMIKPDGRTTYSNHHTDDIQPGKLIPKHPGGYRDCRDLFEHASDGQREDTCSVDDAARQIRPTHDSGKRSRPVLH